MNHQQIIDTFHVGSRICGCNGYVMVVSSGWDLCIFAGTKPLFGRWRSGRPRPLSESPFSWYGLEVSYLHCRPCFYRKRKTIFCVFSEYNWIIISYLALFDIQAHKPCNTRCMAFCGLFKMSLRSAKTSDACSLCNWGASYNGQDKGIYCFSSLILK